MEEGNHHLLCAWTGSLVDKTYAFAIAFSQCVGHAILNGESNMMNATSAVCHEFGYCALFACGFQEFEFHLAYFQEGSLHLLVGHFFNCVTLQSEYLLEIGKHLINALDCDAKMINTLDFHNDF